MRTLIALVTIVVVLTQLHWTQRHEHVTLALAGPYVSLANSKQAENLCVYKDVTVEGSLVRQETDVIDRNGRTISINGDSVVGMAWDTSAASGFTWRTYLLIAIWLAIAIWSVIPGIKSLS